MQYSNKDPVKEKLRKNRNKRIRKYDKKGFSISKIAAIFGLSYAAVKYVLSKEEEDDDNRGR
jgi:transposase